MNIYIERERCVCIFLLLGVYYSGHSASTNELVIGNIIYIDLYKY